MTFLSYGPRSPTDRCEFLTDQEVSQPPPSWPEIQGFSRGRDNGFPSPPRTDPYKRNCRIRLLPRMHGVEAHVRMRMQDLSTWNPSTDQRQEPRPEHPVALAPPP